MVTEKQPGCFLFFCQRGCVCGEHRPADAPGLHGNEVSGGEELCAQRFGSSQRPAGQPALRQDQRLWAVQGPGGRRQLL